MAHRDPIRAELIEGSHRRATPFTRTWYAGWLVIGVVLAVGGAMPNWEPSLSLASLPDWVAIAVGVTIALGACLLLYGSRTQVLLSVSWALEQIGCTVTGAGWLAYGIAAAWASPGAVMSWASALISATTLMVRWRTLRQREEVTRSVVQGDTHV